MNAKEFNDRLHFSYRGKAGRVVPAKKGMKGMVTFALGNETFGPCFCPSEGKLYLAARWLESTGHKVTVR